MELMELIRTRKSVRTFDGNAVSEEDRKKLSEYIRTIDDPYGIPVKFVILNENGKIVLDKLKPIIYNEEEVSYMSVGEKVADAFKTGMQFKKKIDGGYDHE